MDYRTLNRLSMVFLSLASKISRRISLDVIARSSIVLITGVLFASITKYIHRFLMVTTPIRHRILMKVVILWVAAILIVNFLIAFILISVVYTTIAIQVALIA